MKYKLKIVPQDGGYVGYALLNDEVVYTSNVHKDTVMASRELSNYVASVTEVNPVPVRRANSALKTPPAPIQGVSSAQTAPVRRCCGRS
jgi:hypothetical protein